MKVDGDDIQTLLEKTRNSHDRQQALLMLLEGTLGELRSVKTALIQISDALGTGLTPHETK